MTQPSSPSRLYANGDREADQFIVSAKAVIVRLHDLTVFQGTVTADEAREAIADTAQELNELLAQIAARKLPLAVNQLFVDAVALDLDKHGVIYPAHS